MSGSPDSVGQTVAVTLLGWRSGFGNPEIFAGPRTKVDAPSTHTAERTGFVLRAVNAVATTGRAADDSFKHYAVGSVHCYCRRLGAKRDLERRIFATGVQTVIVFVSHQTDGYHQSVTADFGN